MDVYPELRAVTQVYFKTAVFIDVSVSWYIICESLWRKISPPLNSLAVASLKYMSGSSTLIGIKSVKVLHELTHGSTVSHSHWSITWAHWWDVNDRCVHQWDTYNHCTKKCSVCTVQRDFTLTTPNNGGWIIWKEQTNFTCRLHLINQLAGRHDCRLPLINQFVKWEVSRKVEIGGEATSKCLL